MKKIFLGLIIAMSTYSLTAVSAAYTDWAVPTEVELVSGGVLIKGTFGDPTPCGQANYLFISESNSRFDSIMSMALAALMANREMRFRANSCVEVNAHWAGNIINQTRGAQSVYIR